MQRILMAALPLFLFAASGCDFFQHKEKFYTYCDANRLLHVRSEWLQQRRRRSDRLELLVERDVRLGLLLRPEQGRLRRGRLLHQQHRLYRRADL